MCLGGGDTTVSQKAAPKTPEEIEAIKLGLESMRLRNKYLPALMQQFGYGQDAQGTIMKLPPTQEQQQQAQLMTTSYQGAQDAAGTIRSRLGMAEGLLPGLLRSVQASMAPGTRSAGAIGGPPQMLPQFRPQEPSLLMAPPAATSPVPVGLPVGTPPGTAPGVPTGPLSRVEEVTALYQTLLGRAPDQPGLDSWVNSDKSIDQIKAEIMNSPEYLAKQGPPPQGPPNAS